MQKKWVIALVAVVALFSIAYAVNYPVTSVRSQNGNQLLINADGSINATIAPTAQTPMTFQSSVTVNALLNAQTLVTGRINPSGLGVNVTTPAVNGDWTFPNQIQSKTAIVTGTGTYVGTQTFVVSPQCSTTFNPQNSGYFGNGGTLGADGNVTIRGGTLGAFRTSNAAYPDLKLWPTTGGSTLVISSMGVQGNFEVNNGFTALVSTLTVTNTINFPAGTTGASTALFTNCPGAGFATPTWILVQVNGVAYYIPAVAR